MTAKAVLFLLLVVISLASKPVTANPSNTDAPDSLYAQKTKASKDETDKYSGYSVDGRTSPSVLAAQRSHTVAGEDERNFAVFTGIVVIFIVFFFLKIDFLKK